MNLSYTRGPIALGAALFGLLLALAAPAQAQTRTDRVRVFLDCQDFGCDFDFFRTEIGFVDWVRDRTDAEVHLLATQRSTGAGGREYTLRFIGQDDALPDQQLRHVSPPAASDDAIRRGLARTIKLGLVPYVANTDAAERIRIDYEAAGPDTAAAEAVVDPWNYWVFSLGIGSYISGEARQRSLNFDGAFEADRVTDEWKIESAVRGSYGQDIFEDVEVDPVTGDTAERTYTSEEYNYGVNGLVVKSRGPHWSIGLRGSAEATTYYNQDLALRFAPAVEYSLFPYRESTRRQLTVLYSLGGVYFDWMEETIFGRTSEARVEQALRVEYEVAQPWGSGDVAIEGSHYVFEPSKFSVDVWGDLELRLFRGFALDLSGEVAVIRDQLYLRAGDADLEDILLQRQALETGYRYWASVGLSYTFGSIYNSVVNPRF